MCAVIGFGLFLLGSIGMSIGVAIDGGKSELVSGVINLLQTYAELWTYEFNLEWIGNFLFSTVLILGLFAIVAIPIGFCIKRNFLAAMIVFVLGIAFGIWMVEVAIVLFILLIIASFGTGESILAFIQDGFIHIFRL